MNWLWSPLLLLSVTFGLALSFVLLRDPAHAVLFTVMTYGMALLIPDLVRRYFLEYPVSLDVTITWVDIIAARLFWTCAFLPYFIHEVGPWLASAAVVVAVVAGVGLQRPPLPRAFRIRWAMAGALIAFLVFVSSALPEAIFVALLLVPIWAAYLTRADFQRMPVDNGIATTEAHETA